MGKFKTYDLQVISPVKLAHFIICLACSIHKYWFNKLGILVTSMATDPESELTTEFFLQDTLKQFYSLQNLNVLDSPTRI